MHRLRFIRPGALAVLGLFTILAADSRAQTVRIFISEPYASALSDLTDQYPNLEFVTVSTAVEIEEEGLSDEEITEGRQAERQRIQEEILEKVVACDAYLNVPGGDRGAEIIKAGKKLRWVQTASAGVENHVSIPGLVESDIVLTNAKIIQGPEIADHAMALLLNFTRDLKFFNEQMAERIFRRGNRLPMIELRGKTALIIGLGGIGTQVAQRAAAFGMRVLAVDPKDIPLSRDVEYVGKPDDLNDLLPQADVVFSCVPLTPQSMGMLGKEQFDLMKEGVYLINVSRGRIVDTEALIEALRSGKVRAAGLDVTEPEPLPEDSPLWSMPNVTITPHVATMSDQLQTRRIQLFRDNVERFLEGRPLRNVVDKQKGY